MAQVFASAIDLDRCATECIHPDAIRPLIGRSLSIEGAARVADLFGTLADPSRARILHLLAISDRPLCVCDIALVVGLSVSAVSHQLAMLRERRAVARDKVGRIAYYRLIDDHLRALLHDASTHVMQTTD